ncbi:MAG: CBS domain-containing protein [Planctomycetota bacterium]
MRLAEFMTREVYTLRAEDPLSEALEFLRERKVRHIPILDAQRNLVGVLTDRDIKRATPSPLAPGQREVWERVMNETPLEKVMSRDPTTATPENTLEEALETFVAERIGCLPVLRERQLVGIVTAQDLFKATLEVLRRARRAR